MTRYVITINDQKIGQAGSWHKALDMLIRQEIIQRFRVEIVANNYIIVNDDLRDVTYYIKKEAI